MDSKKRRYEFESKVKVPNMDEIRKAAGQFADPPEQPAPLAKKPIPGAREAAQRSVKKVMNEELSSMKNEMEELANAVILEEQKRKEEEQKALDAELLASEAETDDAADDSAPDESEAESKEELSIPNE